MIRIDSNGELSFYVDPDHRGQGIGTWLIQEACKRSTHPRLKASVDETNKAALRAFEKSGVFTPDPTVVFLIHRP